MFRNVLEKTTLYIRIGALLSHFHPTQRFTPQIGVVPPITTPLQSKEEFHDTPKTHGFFLL